MSAHQHRKLLKALATAAPLALAGVAHGQVNWTWIGSTGSWGDAANWAPTGVPNSLSEDVSIGNNGVVSVGGGSFSAESLRLGYNHTGATNPGTGQLNVDSGLLYLSNDSYIGVGAAGTLNINGGHLQVEDTEHLYIGGGQAVVDDGGGGTITVQATAPAWINITSGTLEFQNRYGIEKWHTNAAAGTIIMTGGRVFFARTGAPCAIEADFFSFTGGSIEGIRGGLNHLSRFVDTTIHEIAGAGSITFEPNSVSRVLLNLANNSTWDGRMIGGGASLRGTVVKQGAGVLTVTGAQGQWTNTGGLTGDSGTRIEGGAIRLAADNVLGVASGTLTLADAPGVHFDLNGFAQTVRALNGGGATGGNILLGAGTLTVQHTDAANPATYSGVISGSGALVKGGSGTQVLSGANTYSGSTNITTGIVQLNNALAAQNSSVLVNSPNGLAFGAGIGTFTLGGLGGSNTVTLADTVAAGVALRVGSNNGTTTMNGGVTGSGALYKIGSGTLVLTGQNGAVDYTGGTTVEAGNFRMFQNAWPIALSSAAGVDVRGGRMFFDYTGGSTPTATIIPLLDAGFDVNFASGQIRSGTAVAGALGLGWKDDTAASQFVVMYTRYGDANLDGITNIGDFSLLASNYNSPGSVWGTGDFNYDGVTGIGDFSLLAANYNQSVAASAARPGAVPEPAMCGALAIATILAARRRQAR